ncbi:hypothetical protein NL676_039226 [Syzygium grande]|nr:hypothetical protein NL676_039226 [Syzygium grande]
MPEFSASSPAQDAPAAGRRSPAARCRRAPPLSGLASRFSSPDHPLSRLLPVTAAAAAWSAAAAFPATAATPRRRLPLPKQTDR